MGRVDLTPERAGQPDLVEFVDPQLVHQEAHAGVQGGLGQLDGPHVGLGDGDAWCARDAFVQDVAEGPAVGHDAWRACGRCAIDDPVLGDDAREVELRHDLDDPRPADPGDPGLGDPGLECRLVRPGVDADDPDARLQRLAIDPDAFDRTRRGALAAGDLGTLEGGAGGARRGQQPTLVAQHDLRVRADIDDEGHPLCLMGLFGEDDAGRVRADVAGDARQDVDARTRVRPQAEFRRRGPDRPIRGQGERRATQWRRIDAQQEVVHDRVADDRQLQDLGPLDPGPHGQRGDEPIERLAHRLGHLTGALGMHHRVGDPAHQVLAVADLWIHDAVAGENGAVGQVGEVAGDRGGPDIDGDAIGRLVEAGPDPDDLVRLVDRDGHAVPPGLQRRLERTDDLQVRLQIGQCPLALQRLEQSPEVAGG